MKYTEGYEQSKGKGSFPAMLTPAYEVAKKAGTLASSVSKDSCGPNHMLRFVYVEMLKSHTVLFIVTYFFSSILHVLLIISRLSIRRDMRRGFQSTPLLSIHLRCY